MILFMAEESSDPPVTPEKKEFGSRKMGKNSAGTPSSLNSGRITCRSSIGSDHNGEHARRYSSEKPDSANISQHMIPHYLRASTGSCHDICKYGRRHAFEEKAWKPLRKRTAKPSLNELNSTEIIVSGEQTKEKVVKHEPSADTKKLSLLVKPSPDAKSFSPKLKASLDVKTHSPRQNASCSGKTHLPYSPTKKSTSSDPPEIIKREILLPKEVEVPVKVGNSTDNKMTRTDKKTYDQSVNRSSSVKSKPVKVKSSSASDNSDGIHGKGRRNNDVQTGRKMRSSTTSANKTLVPAAAPLFPKFSLSKTVSNKAIKSGRVKLLSPRNDQNRIDRVETETSNSQVSEKTLHVIQTGTENNALESIPDNHAISALASPSSPVCMSHANPSSLFHEEDDEEIKYSGNETGEFAPDNTVSMEIGKVKPVKENHESLRMGTGKNALESIPDGHAIPALTSRSSPKSVSPAKHPSLLSHEEDDEEMKYSGNDADEFVLDNIVSMEIDKVMETENNEFESIPDGHVIPALPSPSSSKSLSRGKSPSLLSHEESLLSHEEDDEDIKHSGKEADKLLFGNIVSVEIGKGQPLKGNHNKTPRKNRVVSAGDNYRRPVKLKFRSGKVVDLPQGNNVPIRLRFRRTRVSSNKADDSVSDKKKSVEIGNVQPVKENNKTLRKSRVVVSEDKYRSPVKLFRSEKLLGIESDNNIPWRLRFRRARIPGVEDDKGDLKRTTFKKAGGEDAAAGAELSSRKVNLKHQDLQGKKDAQCLFNNVIEETAIKLVESRKSKVKALVGAFETVISLQECKPSLRTAS